MNDRNQRTEQEEEMKKGSAESLCGEESRRSLTLSTLPQKRNANDGIFNASTESVARQDEEASFFSQSQRESVASFAQRLMSGGGTLTMRFIDASTSTTALGCFESVEEVVAGVKRFTTRGYDSFYCLNETTGGTKEEQTKVVRGIRLDLDGAPLENVEQLELVGGLKPHFVIQTSGADALGKPRYQIVYLLEPNCISKDELRDATLAFARFTQSDTAASIAHGASLSRMPGSVNFKKGRNGYIVRIASWNDHSVYTRGDVLRAFSDVSETRADAHRAHVNGRGGHGGETLETVLDDAHERFAESIHDLYELASGLNEGTKGRGGVVGRDDFLTKAVGWLITHGFTESECCEHLDRLNDSFVTSLPLEQLHKHQTRTYSDFVRREYVRHEKKVAQRDIKRWGLRKALTMNDFQEIEGGGEQPRFERRKKGRGGARGGAGRPKVEKKGVDFYIELLNRIYPEHRKEILSNELFVRSHAAGTREGGEFKNLLETSVLAPLRIATRQTPGASVDMLTDFLPMYENQLKPRLLIDIPEWQGEDMIARFARCLECSNFPPPQVEELLRDWLAGIFRRINDRTTYNRMLVLHGAQGIGKDHFLRTMLRELNEYYASTTFHDFVKDTDIFQTASRSLVLNLSEFDQLSERRLPFLKDLISKESVQLRTAYARTPREYVFRTSFCGSCNTYNFLQDATGNRRYVVFALKQIKWEYPRDQESVMQLLAQAKTLALDNEPLTAETHSQLTAQQSEDTPTPIEEIICELFDLKVNIFVREKLARLNAIDFAERTKIEERYFFGPDKFKLTCKEALPILQQISKDFGYPQTIRKIQNALGSRSGQRNRWEDREFRVRRRRGYWANRDDDF